MPKPAVAIIAAMIAGTFAVIGTFFFIEASAKDRVVDCEARLNAASDSLAEARTQAVGKQAKIDDLDRELALCFESQFSLRDRLARSIQEVAANATTDAAEREKARDGWTPVEPRDWFRYANVTHRPDTDGSTIIGQIRNDSGKSYAWASFEIAIYDAQGYPCGLESVTFSTFGAGQTRLFEVWSDEPLPTDWSFTIAEAGLVPG